MHRMRNYEKQTIPAIRQVTGLAGVLLVFLVFNGCVAPPGPGTGNTADGRLAPSPHEVVGHVALVDAARDMAVVNLESHVRVVSKNLTARNEILLETAILEPTSQRSGRSLGVRILSGLPNIGDEVVVSRE